MYLKIRFLGCALLCWTVIIAQYFLMIQNRVVSIPETSLRFFSFFTILTNILVAIVFTANYFKSKKGFKFFVNPRTQSAVGVYIFIVGFVYNLILRFIWKPIGLQQIVDEFLHLIIPIGYIMYWFYYVNKATISWKSIYVWLLYPLIYICTVLFLGSLSTFYPYPFINATALGYTIVLRNAFLLTLFFGLVSLLFVCVAKYSVKKQL